jgi:hypothetical protein
MSIDNGPTAALVCAAVLDGFMREGVCRQLWVENGFVFGRALNVNGKEDDQGRTVVAGLAKYCPVHHFNEMEPTSKSELEKSFDLIQVPMEPHPGYGGRDQRKDASEDFKREQRLINSGKLTLEEAKKYRYTYEEFRIVMYRLVEEYNNEEQFGHLNGLSPNEAFKILADPKDPPIKFTNELHWYLANERYLVQVTGGGSVRFNHYGRTIKVRDAALVSLAGEWLWALVDRRDDSMVTFMTQNYDKTFTLKTNRKPSADASRTVTGREVLADELRKISECMRAVADEGKQLVKEFGDPRKDLLAKIRGDVLSGVKDEATRQTIVDSRIAASAVNMEEQREAIRDDDKKKAKSKRDADRLLGGKGIVVQAGRLSEEEMRLIADDLEEGS